MTLFLRLKELTGKVYHAVSAAFSQIFPAFNQRELIPAPVSTTLIPSTMKKNLLFSGTFLSVLFLCFAFSTAALGQATVTSDKPDYAPRSTAVFTGAGFQPGETVQLKVKNLFRPCNTVSADSSYLPWSVVADANGGFVTNWTVCDCAGDSLRLKATGLASGQVAILYFM